MNRRKFLTSAGIMLASASAYSFGQTLVAKVNKSDKVAIIYGTRYGSSADTSRWIAEGMNVDVDLLDISKIDYVNMLQKYDKLIIGSGIWIDGPHKRLIKMLSEHSSEIEQKLVASFIVCGTTGKDTGGMQRIEAYLNRLHKPLNKKPKISKHFGGRLTIEKLTETDRKLLDNFYRNVLKREFISWDRTDSKLAKEFGSAISKRVPLSI